MDFTLFDDPLSALDALAFALVVAAIFAALPAPVHDASLRLERLLLAATFTATALVLWNAIDGPAYAWLRWRGALLPALLIGMLLRLAPHLHLRPRLYPVAASTLLSLLWIDGLLR